VIVTLPLVMGGCMDVMPPCTKFKLHSRRLNVLVCTNGFGFADGCDHLVSGTGAV